MPLLFVSLSLSSLLALCVLSWSFYYLFTSNKLDWLCKQVVKWVIKLFIPFAFPLYFSFCTCSLRVFSGATATSSHAHYMYYMQCDVPTLHNVYEDMYQDCTMMISFIASNTFLYLEHGLRILFEWWCECGVHAKCFIYGIVTKSSCNVRYVRVHGTLLHLYGWRVFVRTS